MGTGNFVNTKSISPTLTIIFLTFILISGPVLGGILPFVGFAAAQEGTSAFPHVTDGAFTGLEWSDVTFIEQGTTFLYADQADLDPLRATPLSPVDTFMLMYDECGRTVPLGPNEYFLVHFMTVEVVDGIEEIEHYVIHIFTDGTIIFFENGVIQGPGRDALVEGQRGDVGFGTSPNCAFDHVIAEFQVELTAAGGGSYSPDPLFWSSDVSTPPITPPGDVDSDGDGVPDEFDDCPGTPPGTPVGPDGCPLPPPDVDSDGDGVPDEFDDCPGTPPGVPVGPDGCPPGGIGIGLGMGPTILMNFIEFAFNSYQEGLYLFGLLPVAMAQLPDFDGDGVPDEVDNCPFNPNPLQEDSNFNGIGDACETLDLVHSTAAFLQAILDGTTTVQGTPLTVADEPPLLEQVVLIVNFRVGAGLTNSVTDLTSNLVGSLVDAGLVPPEDEEGFANDVIQSIETPRDLKQDAIVELERIKTDINGAEEVGDPEEAIEEIDKAIERINESLDPELWNTPLGVIDPFRLNPEEGDEVFGEEKHAAQDIFDSIDEGEINNTTIIAELLRVVNNLVTADRLLAVLAIDDARANPNADPEEIAEAEESLAEGDQLIADAEAETDLDEKADLIYDAMDDSYGDAWDAAIDAVEEEEEDNDDD